MGTVERQETHLKILIRALYILQRSRKRKALEAGEQELEPEVAHAAKEVKNGKGKGSRKLKSAVPEADEPEPEPQLELARMTAPVAR
ncbi:hypothetical protein VE03_10605, partial [Pseudogymnoascus sp. 23342-1-I1]